MSFDGNPRAPAAAEADVTVLIPVTDVWSPLEGLVREVSEALDEADLDHRMLLVVDGDRPDQARRLEALGESDPRIGVIRARNQDPEAAVPGIVRERVRSPLVLTLPSYPRVSASGLPELVRAVGPDVDLVSAARATTAGALVNRAQRRSFHYLLGKLVGGRLTDVACGVRAMRREVLEEVRFFGDTFRFLPILALRDGFRVREMALAPHPEDLASRVYAPGIYIRRLIDLAGLAFIVRFVYKPLRFFGLVGSVLAGVGLVILAILFVQRIGGHGIADRPLLLLGVLLVVSGLQSIALGLVGEAVVHHGLSTSPSYRLLPDEEPDRAGAHGPAGERAPESVDPGAGQPWPPG